MCGPNITCSSEGQALRVLIWEISPHYKYSEANLMDPTSTGNLIYRDRALASIMLPSSVNIEAGWQVWSTGVEANENIKRLAPGV